MSEGQNDEDLVVDRLARELVMVYIESPAMDSNAAYSDPNFQRVLKDIDETRKPHLALMILAMHFVSLTEELRVELEKAGGRAPRLVQDFHEDQKQTSQAPPTLVGDVFKLIYATERQNIVKTFVAAGELVSVFAAESLFYLAGLVNSAALAIGNRTGRDKRQVLSDYFVKWENDLSGGGLPG